MAGLEVDWVAVEREPDQLHDGAQIFDRGHLSLEVAHRDTAYVRIGLDIGLDSEIAPERCRASECFAFLTLEVHDAKEEAAP